MPVATRTKGYSPRYLTDFNPKSVPHRFADVLIIGGGLAGLRAALEIDDSLSVVVITKDELKQSNSSYAQGGIAGVIDPDDNIQWHIDDTISAGGNLCNRETVEMVIRQAPACIRQLIEMGTRFDRESGDAELTLGREGGHSHNRIVHAMGDATGAEIMRAVIQRVKQQKHIRVLENTFTLDLLTHKDQCRGAIVAASTELQLIWAKQTILCTGGAGQLYRETTNPAVATADGHAMAFRAGVELRDMEFMQFHPTVLYIAGSSRSLISEAVRGEGAYLRDAKGFRFMEEYDERMELAPRDIVAQAIVSQMEKTKASNVFLDLSHLQPDHIHGRFPGIARACAEFGLDIATDPIPVRPGAHYMIGGIATDLDGQTSMSGLWAAGEASSSGLHGANRLASNSLLEGIVFGIRAGQSASLAAMGMPDRFVVESIQHEFPSVSHQQLDLADILNSLKSLMWRCVGVRRNGDELKQAETTVKTWQQYVLAQPFQTTNGWELQNMLTVAHVMIQAAICRTESRGVHLRTDFPELDDEEWRSHVCILGSELTVKPA